MRLMCPHHFPAHFPPSSPADYALGINGRSHVVGFGSNYPSQIHHWAASCPKRPTACGWAEFDAPSPNPQLLLGALVGGPSGCDFSDDCAAYDNTHNDLRSDFVTNEARLRRSCAWSGAVFQLHQRRSTAGQPPPASTASLLHPLTFSVPRQVALDYNAGLVGALAALIGLKA